MKPHLPLSLLLAFTATLLAPSAMASIYTDAEFTYAYTGNAPVTTNQAFTSNNPDAVPNIANGAVDLSAGYAGALTIHGTATANQRFAVTAANGGYGGRVSFSGAHAEDLTAITLDKGIEASMGSVFANASNFKISFDNASFSIDGAPLWPPICTSAKAAYA